MFYIRKVKDEHRIMSQAINKEAGFSSQQHFQLVWCLMPYKFIALRLNTLKLNWLQQRLGWQGNAWTSGLKKNCDMFTRLAILCCF